MTEQEIIQKTQTLIKRLDSLRISGPGWSGNSREGFQFNPASGIAGAAGGTPPPVCVPPTIHIVCDSVFCQADKCGFPEYPGFESNPPKYYLHYERHITCVDQTCDETQDWTPNYVDCFGGLECDFSQEFSEGCDTFSCPCALQDPVPISATHAEWFGDCLTPNDLSVIDDISNEFTDDDLVGIVLALLPGYSGTFGGCGGAGGTVAASGFVKAAGKCHFRFYIERFKYKFTFDEATCNFTIHWRETYTPYTTDESCNLVAGTPYHVDFSEPISTGQTESSIYTRDEPDDDNTTVEVTDITTSVP